MVAKEDLVKGEIYVSLHDNVDFNSIFTCGGLNEHNLVMLKNRLCLKYRNHNDNFTISDKETNWVKETKFRNATYEEKDWLKECILQNAFIPFEQLKLKQIHELW